MILWRLCRAERAATAFDGEGARLYPGRWNHLDVPVVYCASSLALAAIEYFVHLDSDELPDDLVSIRVELSDSVNVERVDAKKLPKDWHKYPGPMALQNMGTEWAAGLRTVALLVPAATMPIETNVVLNPRHADMSKLIKGEPEPFLFDPRMRKSP
jgi:RES domain-containing protein